MTVRLCVLDILDLMAFGIKSEASSKKTNNQMTNIFLVVSKYTWTNKSFQVKYLSLV